MSIYEKLSKVQLALMRRDIKKTGWNKFKKYHYYTLDDLIPPCMEECNNEGLTFFFNFRNNEAIIRLHEWENPKEGISCGLPFPELIQPDDDAKNKNNLLVQDFGAAVTYLKRYLLINLFDITDIELIDSECDDDASSTKQESKTVKSQEPDISVPALIVEAEKTLKAKGIESKDITRKSLKQTILRMNKWSVAERRVILNYFKEASK